MGDTSIYSEDFVRFECGDVALAQGEGMEAREWMERSFLLCF